MGKVRKLNTAQDGRQHLILDRVQGRLSKVEVRELLHRYLGVEDIRQREYQVQKWEGAWFSQGAPRTVGLAQNEQEEK
jgi:hypothetical protein